MVLTTGMSCGSVCLTCSLPVRKCGRKRFATTLAKRNQFQQNNGNNNNNNTKHKPPFFPLRVSKLVVARTAIGVFGLGFIDAGYSGDWSRIGVITPQSEELLRLAAFLVVPLCIFLIFSLSDESDS